MYAFRRDLMSGKRSLVMKNLLYIAILAGICSCTLSTPAQAQRMKTNAVEKSHWHNAPREYQIIDERPIIRDFREAPQEAGTIELPPAPGGFSGGGGGGGALGNIPSTLPSGGLQLGGPNQGFRSAPAGLGSLPKSGFGGTNIPARGLGPRNALPSGQSTNTLMGKMNNPGKGVGAGAPRGMSRSAGPTSGYSGPAVSSYGGGYGSGSGPASGGSASRTDTNVRGRLLNAK